jgi:hypothetical protein
MTVPPAPPAPTPYDTGNPLLAEQPAQFGCALVDTPAGQRLALTTRTPSATLTVLLAGADARNWARQLSAAAEAMSVTGLVVAGGAPGSPVKP